ncbi:hypothetical protein ND748_31640, partial [Frankia sp. AiPs1]|uniref:hypothetical protein n=1 Tax=Frankia sp. AiPs1 TaxID=573493 RepID=UPI0035ABC25F|nr:hypothetical protein [Frankia sp. AiPs1]
MGIQGVGRLRKGQLIAAIQNLQNGEAAGGSATAPATDLASAAPIPAPSEAPSAAPLATRQSAGDGGPSTRT